MSIIRIPWFVGKLIGSLAVLASLQSGVAFAVTSCIGAPTVNSCAVGGVNVCGFVGANYVCDLTNSGGVAAGTLTAVYNAGSGNWEIWGVDANGGAYCCNIAPQNTLTTFGGPANDAMDLNWDNGLGVIYHLERATSIMHGGDGADDLTGADTTSVTETIWGEDGDDVIHGMVGSDTLNGGLGADIIFGGYGADTIAAGSDDDLVYGDAGADLIDLGAGNDTCYGGADNDRIHGDELYTDPTGGLNDADSIKGDAGLDILWGEWGDDEICGGVGIDALYGNNGDDILFGGGALDTTNDGGPDVDNCENDSPAACEAATVVVCPW